MGGRLRMMSNKTKLTGEVKASLKRQLLNYLIIFEATLIVFLTGLAIKVRDIGIDVPTSKGLKVFLLLIAFPIIWLCCLAYFGAWDVRIFDNHYEGYRLLMKSSFMTFLVFSSASYAFKIQISRFVILFSLIGGTIIHLLLRWIFLRVADKKLKKNSLNRWLAISPNGEMNQALGKYAEDTKTDIKYIASFENQKSFESWMHDLTKEFEQFDFEKLFLCSTQELSRSQIEEIVWLGQSHNGEVLVLSYLGAFVRQRQVAAHSEGDWISLLLPRINESHRVLKRLLDLALVTPSLILLSPLFLVIGIAIMVDSKGSPIYIQRRIGQNGVHFTFPKFRSMKQGSDEKRMEILGSPDVGMVERYRNDPRITRIGRILRRFSLDELPQLWCVLIGTMSLVGPRPILPEEEPHLESSHFKRNIAKPGLTGIWQVSGRKETSWQDRMFFDLEYIRDWSVGLDVILIARTFKAIFTGKGSY